MGNINISVSSNHRSFCIIFFGEHQLQPVFDDTPYLQLTYLPWRKNTGKFPGMGLPFPPIGPIFPSIPWSPTSPTVPLFPERRNMRKSMTAVVPSPRCNPSTAAVFPEHGKSRCKADKTNTLVWENTWTHCKFYSFSIYLDLFVPTWAAEALL